MLRHLWAGVLPALALAGAGFAAHASDEPQAEVQINLCSPPKQIIRALGLEATSAKPVEVWYFDTAALDLLRQGLVLRLRIKASESELTLKAKSQDCTRLDTALLSAGDGKCEYDLHGAKLEGAVSLNAALDDAAVSGLLEGRVPLAQVLSPAQIRFLREGARIWPLPGGLERLGPVRIRAYRNAQRRFVVEVWRLPSGRRFVEISQKTARDHAPRIHDELAQTLAQSGVQLCQDQSSQARAKLEDLLRVH